MTDPKTIIITDKAHGLPFSKGLLAQSFTATGLAPSKAWSIAQSIEEELREHKETRISSERVRSIAARAPAALGRGQVRGALPEAARRHPTREPAHRADRRHHGSRQVDDRHGGRAPARDQPHHVDGFHPGSHAWYIHQGPHARDSRERVQRVAGSESPGAAGRQSRDRRLSRADGCRQHRHQRADQARGARRHVDGG